MEPGLPDSLRRLFGEGAITYVSTISRLVLYPVGGKFLLGTWINPG